MHKTATNIAYTAPDGAPVLSSTYSLTQHEGDIVGLRDLIVAEGYAPIEAGVLAIPALPNPDPTFVEWLTSGVLTLDEAGALIPTGPGSIEWLNTVTKTGRAW